MDTNYDRIKDQISRGMLPTVTGLHFTQVQIDEIEAMLEARKVEINEYFTRSIKCRNDSVQLQKEINDLKMDLNLIGGRIDRRITTVLLWIIWGIAIVIISAVIRICI